MNNIAFAFKKALPLVFSYIFVGIASGILLYEAGYAPIWAFFSSLFIYAGSMQIVMISMMASGMPLPMIGVMTFFINARHIFYGINFLNRYRKIGGWKYPYMALTMTDDTYSVLCQLNCSKDIDEDKVHFYILFFCHMLWIVSCTAGALMGDVLPFDMTGIEFSATAFFTVVVVNQWMQLPSHAPAIIGLLSAVIFYFILGADNFILPALSVSLVMLLMMKEGILPRMEVPNE